MSDSVDRVDRNARARHGGFDGAGAKLGRRRILQRAEKGAHGRARGAEDDYWVYRAHR